MRLGSVSKRIKKIDYHKKEYVNPFFRRQKKISSGWSWKKRIVSVSIFMAGVILFWFFFYSDFFMITKIEINGLSRIPKDEIEKIILKQTRNKRFGVFAERNYFILDKQMLYDHLDYKYCFENISIKKKLPKTIVATFKERPYAFIYSELEHFYYADSDGKIAKEVSPLDIKEKNYPLIYNESNNFIDDNYVGFDAQYTNYVINLFHLFNTRERMFVISPENENDYVVEKFIFDKDLNSIKVKILNGPKIIFNIKKPAEEQLEKLRILIDQKVGGNFAKKEYFDLRYGDNIYYQ